MGAEWGAWGSYSRRQELLRAVRLTHFFKRTQAGEFKQAEVQRSGGRSLRVRKGRRAEQSVFVERRNQEASQAGTRRGAAASATRPRLQVKTQRALT